MIRLVVIISLLLSACATCALQLLPVEPRTGFRSSVIQRRSTQLVSQRRRLAHRGIESSIGVDIVPRGNPIPQYSEPTQETTPRECSFYDSLQAILQAKAANDITLLKSSQNVKVYKVNYPCHFDGKQVVVKEIHMVARGWTEDGLKLEVSRIMKKGELLGALFVDGNTCYIIMKDLGNRWDPSSGPDAYGPVAKRLMQLVNARDRIKYALTRRDPLFVYDYTWTRRSGDWVVRSVGKWRLARDTGHVPGVPVPTNRHYCGIKGWDHLNLPIFLRPETDTITVQHHMK